MVCHVGHGRSLKHAFVTNRLITPSRASHHACQPVEHIVANVLNFFMDLSGYLDPRIFEEHALEPSEEHTPTSLISRASGYFSIDYQSHGPGNPEIRRNFGCLSLCGKRGRDQATLIGAFVPPVTSAFLNSNGVDPMIHGLLNIVVRFKKVGVTGSPSAPTTVVWLRPFFPHDDTHPSLISGPGYPDIQRHFECVSSWRRKGRGRATLIGAFGSTVTLICLSSNGVNPMILVLSAVRVQSGGRDGRPE
ncbi:hypothetical protein Y032_0075g975 [Ancylostoma ceylanicum]|uniref:Uncharacterized protein n=1 Tax=Ancylostoma ceylanicum TaxID=53326 RepID=A0A016TV34_9BILA|nr:hypothetical protein Y032_0075g975 [Ancylostoma ceylanicum]